MRKLLSNPSIEELKEVSKDIAQLSDVCNVILFGSRARGSNRPSSDVDLMVIINDDHIDTFEETVKIELGLTVSMSMDLIVVSKNDFENFKHIPGSVYKRAALEGISLYGS